MRLSESELSDLIIEYVFDISYPLLNRKEHKYREHIKKLIEGNVNRIYDIDGEEIILFNVEEYFPFLAVSPKEYKITDELLDKTILLCAEVNAYIKEKQFTPKESRIFYDIKRQFILNLHKFSDRVIDEWSEERDEDKQIFISYKIKLSDGNTVTFHQPFRNVADILYKRKLKREAILGNKKEYHHDTDYTFALSEDEKKEMYKKSSILAILCLVVKNYLVKQLKEKN